MHEDNLFTEITQLPEECEVFCLHCAARGECQGASRLALWTLAGGQGLTYRRYERTSADSLSRTGEPDRGKVTRLKWPDGHSWCNHKSRVSAPSRCLRACGVDRLSRLSLCRGWGWAIDYCVALWQARNPSWIYAVTGGWRSNRDLVSQTRKASRLLRAI